VLFQIIFIQNPTKIRQIKYMLGGVLFDASANS
jgi:hypothetical protein